ncbi:MAG: hypothetical protein VBE63_06720, partial [Lamprobacter sp.]|uniref:hypothetical protein n=1 Tax=Lamprobacter sp. TaxID=3100796 RepID=UPI002B25D346
MPSRTRSPRPASKTSSSSKSSATSPRQQPPTPRTGRLTFWRKDLDALPAAERRLARFAFELRSLLGTQGSGFSRRVE